MSSLVICSTKNISVMFLCFILCSFSSNYFNCSNLNKAEAQKNSKKNKMKLNAYKFHHNSQTSLDLKSHSHKMKNLTKDKKEKDPKLTKSPSSTSSPIISNTSTPAHLDNNPLPKQIHQKDSKIISDQNKIIDEITLKKNQDISFPNIQRRDFYTYANLLEKCNSKNCPSPNSCITDHICQCSEDRANFEPYPLPEINSENSQRTYCNYIRKKQLVAFVLEFSILSAGHFYIGNYFIGSLKLIALMIAIIVAFKCEEKWAKFVSAGLLIGLILWWTVDAGLFAVNFYPDSNKVLLMEW